jgi:uncharacterized oligopeptide transporter (OPT) family protein
MQVGGLIGVTAAALVMVLPIMLLHEANGIGSEALPAPQAGLMSMMAKGIVGGEMAWPLIIAGMLFATALIMINSPSPMLIAVGMYLPFNTTFAIFIGGLFKYLTDAFAKKRIRNDKDRELVDNTGLLVSSGLIAGEALVGILLAALVVLDIQLKSSDTFNGFWWLGVLVFALLGAIMVGIPASQAGKTGKK